MGRSIDAADTYATVYHTGLSLTRKKVGRGKRAVSYSGLRLAEGFEACRAPNRSGLRSACPCRWPPSAARRSSSLPGTEAVRHRQNPAEPTALRHPAAWGRPRGGSGGWGGGGTLPGAVSANSANRGAILASHACSRGLGQPCIRSAILRAAVGATPRHFSQCDLVAT